jgi:hypothetical protein
MDNINATIKFEDTRSNKQQATSNIQTFKATRMTKAAELAARVDALEALVTKLSVTNNDNKKGKGAADKDDKKPRCTTEKGVIHKAKLLFYQANKDSSEVKKMFKENNGQELTVNFKNWHDVKKITDILFDELSESDKQKHIKKAEATTDKV